MLRWYSRPHEPIYQAAISYLTTKYGEKLAYIAEQKFRNCPEVRWIAAKDVLRACRLDPLSMTDPNVKFQAAQNRLDPVLMVRTAENTDIADGYHRTSLAYNQGPSTLVPVIEATIDFGRMGIR